MNRTEDRFSDERLNAFIDGELDVDEREHLLEALSQDGELSHRACELQKVREMVQLAYDMVPGQERCVIAHAGRGGGRVGQALAAGVLIMVGLSLGWLGNSHWNAPPSNGLLAIADSVQKSETVADENSEWRVMLHVSTEDPRKLDQALKEAEALLQTHQRRHSKLRIEVLANAGGLNLLRADTSPNPTLIRQLQERYENISFMACRQALQRLKDEQGIDPVLLPGTGTVPSAVAQIIERQGDGWTYIRI